MQILNVWIEEIKNLNGSKYYIYYSLHNTVLNKKETNTKTKMIIYNTIATPSIIYYTRMNHDSKITAAEMNSIRDHVRTEQILRDSDQTSLLRKLENKQLEWHGYEYRMKNNRLPKVVLEARRI